MVGRYRLGQFTQRTLAGVKAGHTSCGPRRADCAIRSRRPVLKSSRVRWRSTALSFTVSVVWNGSATRMGRWLFPSTYLTIPYEFRHGVARSLTAAVIRGE